MIVCQDSCREENCKKSFSTKSNRNKNERMKNHRPQMDDKNETPFFDNVFHCPTMLCYEIQIQTHCKTLENVHCLENEKEHCC